MEARCSHVANASGLVVLGVGQERAAETGTTNADFACLWGWFFGKYAARILYFLNVNVKRNLNHRPWINITHGDGC